MSTYAQIGEIVLRKLAGGDIPDDFDVKAEEIYVRIAQISPFLIRKDFYETYRINDGEGIDGSIFSTFSALVQTENDENYVVLPSKPIILNSQGRPTVYFVKDRSYTFIYTQAQQNQMYAKIGIQSEVPGVITMWIENVQSVDCLTDTRLYFDSLPDCVIGKCLKVRMIMSFNEFSSEDDPVGLTPVLEEELINMLYAWYSPQDLTVEDKTNDNQ